MIGLKISIDYKWSLWKLDEDSPEYDIAIKFCHKRAAERLLVGCLKNGGLYVKLGQGLVSMNHILPKEYTETLVILQDKALTMKLGEVGSYLSRVMKKPAFCICKTRGADQQPCNRAADQHLCFSQYREYNSSSS